VAAGAVLPADYFARLARPPRSDDPHRHLDALRVDPPPRLRSGEVVLARHRDVSAVLRDPAFLKPPLPNVPLPSVRAMLRMFILFDGPDHARLRRVVAPLFTASAVDRRRARIEGRVDALLLGRDELDGIADLAYPLPLGLICDALGVPATDAPRISRWGTALLETLDNPMPVTPMGMVRMAKAVALRRSHPMALLRAIHDIAAYASARLADTDPPGDADVLRALQAALRDDLMSPDEAVGTWVLTVIAGHETTANLIGSTLHLLLAHPDQLALVHDDPALVPAAVREALRLESPVPLGVRRAVSDTTVTGLPAPAGTDVLVLFGAANRDPEAFHDPSRYDVLRDQTGHLAFGLGTHFCAGAQLALAETEIAVARVLERRPRLQPGADPRWRPTFATRGIDQLPIALTSSPRPPP
jgi:cytochrome P450